MGIGVANCSGIWKQIWPTGFLAAVALLSGPLFAQDEGVSMPNPPRLPVTAEENWTVKRFTIHREATIYNTWEAKGRKIAILPPGSIVSGIGKLSVIHEPDVVSITRPFPQLGLSPGDTILRYTYEGEGFADFWIKGRWFEEFDGAFITEPDGNGCSKNCRGKVTKIGRKEWWAHVRLSDGRNGWLRVER